MSSSTEVPWNKPIMVNSDGTLHILWQSPSNIALVKYWGKHGQQLPANPSLSFSLRQSVTTMELFASPVKDGKGHLKNFYFEDKHHPGFAQRFGTLIQSLRSEFPSLAGFNLSIHSSNTFPHSAGIASSASGFSALALCLCTLARNQKLDAKNEKEFLQEASYISRLGSGSACRSIYGGFSAWGKTPEFPGSDDHFAIPVNDTIHPAFTDLNDAVLLVSSSPKAISSSQGHSLMNDHPYRQSRINQANSNMHLLAEALRKGDWNSFIEVTESEALTLHALMMSSSPGFILMEPSSIEIMRRIREYRKRSSKPLCFTLDAGPNIHLIYRQQDQDEIRDFIQNELLPLCEDGRWIDDGVGTGPKRLK